MITVLAQTRRTVLIRTVLEIGSDLESQVSIGCDENSYSGYELIGVGFEDGDTVIGGYIKDRDGVENDAVGFVYKEDELDEKVLDSLIGMMCLEDCVADEVEDYLMEFDEGVHTFRHD